MTDLGVKAMKTGALIIATGVATERESPDPLLKVGSCSVIERLILTFQTAGIRLITIVVSEENKKAVEKHAAQMGAAFIRNETPDGEILGDIRCGLSYMSGLCDQILVAPISAPMFSPETVEKLLNSGKRIAVPICNETQGHPILVAGALIPSILKYNGAEGLRGALASCGQELSEIAVDDTGVLAYVHQAGICEEIAKKHGLNQWRPVVKIYIAKGNTLIGPGTRQLLTLIGHIGSVRVACEQMGMSYNKAWQILNGLEQNLGARVVNRKAGGRQGGQTSLTPEAIDFLARFDDFEQECFAATGEIFDRHMIDE